MRLDIRKFDEQKSDGYRHTRGRIAISLGPEYILPRGRWVEIKFNQPTIPAKMLARLKIDRYVFVDRLTREDNERDLKF